MFEPKRYYEARQIADGRWIVASTEGTPLADEPPHDDQKTAEKRAQDLNAGKP